LFGFFFFFNDTATTEIYTLSLHDALPISQYPWRIEPLLLRPDDEYIVYPWSQGEFKVQNWRTGEVKHLLKYAGVLMAVAIAPDGKRIVGAFDQGLGWKQSFVLQVWDFDSGRELDQIKTDGPVPKAIRISSDGRSVFSITTDYTLYVWDLNSGKRLATATLDGMLSCVTIAPDGASILVGDQAGNVYCLDYYHSQRI